MSNSQRDAPPDPRPDGDRDRRRDRVAERTRHLRTIGAAGAIAALGIFTGLAATGDRAGSDRSAQEGGAAEGGDSDRVEDLGDLVAELAGGFFEEDDADDDGGILPSLGGVFSSNSGGS